MRDREDYIRDKCDAIIDQVDVAPAEVVSEFIKLERADASARTEADRARVRPTSSSPARTASP